MSYATLGENCIENAMLPSLATGGRGCSEKWKIEPQEAWASRWSRAIRARGHGQRLWKCIGYDSSKADERRAWRLTSDAEYQYLYPLRDAGWDRGRCQREILAAGLKLPPKSACVYCPASKTWEIARLVRDEPEAADYVCLLEDTARPDMTTVEGLWRNAVKGMRGAVARPGSMAEFIRHCRVDPVYHKYHLDLAPTDPICADVGCDDGLDECNED